MLMRVQIKPRKKATKTSLAPNSPYPTKNAASANASITSRNDCDSSSATEHDVCFVIVKGANS